MNQTTACPLNEGRSDTLPQSPPRQRAVRSLHMRWSGKVPILFPLPGRGGGAGAAGQGILRRRGRGRGRGQGGCWSDWRVKEGLCGCAKGLSRSGAFDQSGRITGTCAPSAAANVPLFLVVPGPQAVHRLGHIPHRRGPELLQKRQITCNPRLHRGSIMVGHRYWMPPPRQFQPMFQVLSTINCYATSSR